jgi:hypothetical protein
VSSRSSGASIRVSAAFNHSDRFPPAQETTHTGAPLGAVAGIVGTLLALPITAAVQIVLRQWKRDTPAAALSPP